MGSIGVSTPSPLTTENMWHSSSAIDPRLIRPLLVGLIPHSLISHPLVFIFNPHLIWFSTFFCNVNSLLFVYSENVLSNSFGLMDPVPLVSILFIHWVHPYFSFFSVFLFFHTLGSFQTYILFDVSDFSTTLWIKWKYSHTWLPTIPHTVKD